MFPGFFPRAGLRPEPDLVRDRGHGQRTARLDGHARPRRNRPQMETRRPRLDATWPWNQALGNGADRDGQIGRPGADDRYLDGVFGRLTSPNTAGIRSVAAPTGLPPVQAGIGTNEPPWSARCCQVLVCPGRAAAGWAVGAQEPGSGQEGLIGLYRGPDPPPRAPDLGLHNAVPRSGEITGSMTAVGLVVEEIRNALGRPAASGLHCLTAVRAETKASFPL
jgi:hypothetical protein